MSWPLDEGVHAGLLTPGARGMGRMSFRKDVWSRLARRARCLGVSQSGQLGPFYSTT